MDSRLFCDICNRNFKSSESLEEHCTFSSAHKTNSRKKLVPQLKKPATSPEFRCDQCNRDFVDRNSLQDHVSHAPNHKRKPLSSSASSFGPAFGAGPGPTPSFGSAMNPTTSKRTQGSGDTNGVTDHAHESRRDRRRNGNVKDSDKGIVSSQDGSRKTRKDQPSAIFDDQDAADGKMRQSDYACGRCNKAFSYKIDRWHHLKKDHPSACPANPPANDRPSWDDAPAWGASEDNNWQVGWADTTKQQDGWGTLDNGWPTIVNDKWPTPAQITPPASANDVLPKITRRESLKNGEKKKSVASEAPAAGGVKEISVKGRAKGKGKEQPELSEELNAEAWEEYDRVKADVEHGEGVAIGNHERYKPDHDGTTKSNGHGSSDLIVLEDLYPSGEGPEANKAVVAESDNQPALAQVHTSIDALTLDDRAFHPQLQAAASTTESSESIQKRLDKLQQTLGTELTCIRIQTSDFAKAGQAYKRGHQDGVKEVLQDYAKLNPLKFHEKYKALLEG